jgi:hypothetical protein
MEEEKCTCQYEELKKMLGTEFGIIHNRNCPKNKNYKKNEEEKRENVS